MSGAEVGLGDVIARIASTAGIYLVGGRRRRPRHEFVDGFSPRGISCTRARRRKALCNRQGGQTCHVLLVQYRLQHAISHVHPEGGRLPVRSQTERLIGTERYLQSLPLSRRRRHGHVSPIAGKRYGRPENLRPRFVEILIHVDPVASKLGPDRMKSLRGIETDGYIRSLRGEPRSPGR